MPSIVNRQVLAVQATGEQQSSEESTALHVLLRQRACWPMQISQLPCQPTPRAVPSFRLLRVRHFLHFQTECYKLLIVAGQHQWPLVPHAASSYMRCDMISTLGDESPVLLECPATQAARVLYAHLFPSGYSMLRI